jgi:hypothetical protein
MDYKKLVNAAGYKGDTAVYIARKLEARKVPKENLNALGSYFKGMSTLAGESLHELGLALYGAAEKADKPKPEVKETTAKTAVKDGD